MFPKAKNDPARQLEKMGGFQITAPVGLDLARPIFSIGFRNRVVIGTSVPEAPVYEDGDSKSRKQYVRSPSESWYRPTIDVEAKAASVELFTEIDFGSGVPTAVRGHASPYAIGRSP
jgi:hypothetical protein